MKHILIFFSIAFFSIFLGSQITEGCLLVPYWETLTQKEFYAYYAKFGPTIGKFYTILTIISVLIPIGTSIYCFSKKSPALKYSIAATFFAFLVIIFFYAYFKNINHQFYEAAFTPDQLKSVLETWRYCHWIRVFSEILSLIFLILTFNMLLQERTSKEFSNDKIIS